MQETRPEPEDPKPGKWYFKKGTLVAALIFVGPFALPLLWFNPKYSLLAKIFWSVVVIGLAIALGWLTGVLLQYLLKQLGALTA